MKSTKIAVLGTGVVGQTIADKLDALGHSVVIGTRDPAATMARTEKGMMGNEPIAVWRKSHPKVGLATFAEAAAHGDILVNATNGRGAIEALKLAGAAADGKILLDITNPLDFSKGMPPSLTVANTDSLGEELQRTFPKLRVVKTLNTMNAFLMVDPGKLAGGDHTVLLAGNDAAAKATTKELLAGFGWKDIIDLGDITNARGLEMYVVLWARIYVATQNANFNIKVVRG